MQARQSQEGIDLRYLTGAQREELTLERVAPRRAQPDRLSAATIASTS